MLFMSLVSFALVFLVLDVIWLKGMNGFYKKEVGSLLLNKPNMKAAILFYLLYVVVVTLLVVYPAVAAGDNLIGYVTLNAGLLGLLAYATYDLTNMATLKDWSWKLVVVDIIWGMAATASAAGLAYMIVRSLL